MNKVSQMIAISLLFTGLNLSLPILAETDKATATVTLEESVTHPAIVQPNPTDSTPVAQTEPEAEDTFDFSIQHRFNDSQPLPKENIAIPIQQIGEQPWIIFETIGKNFSKHLEKQKKPIQINTEVEFLLPPEATQVLGALPKLSIKTAIDKTGAGKSDFVIPADKREIVEPNQTHKTLLDWKGLTGQLSFVDKFESFTTQIDFSGLALTEEQGFSLLWEATSFKGIFDAHRIPTQMDLNLPLFQVQENDDNQLKLKGLTVNLKVKKTTQGLELGNLDFQVGHLGFSEEHSEPIYLDNLRVTTNSQEQGDLVNSTVQTKIDKLLIPKELTLDEALQISYVGNINFHRLDANALLGLQKTIRELQSQNNPMVMGMALLAKFMEVTPQLLAKSPEIALNQLSFTTSQGNLQGNASVRIDGNKATSLETQVLLSALQAGADFNISKNLLTQLMVSNFTREMQPSSPDKKLSEAELLALKKQAQLQTEQQLNKYVEQKWLVDAGKDNYKLVARFKDSKLTVNEQEIPLPFGATTPETPANQLESPTKK